MTRFAMVCDERDSTSYGYVNLSLLITLKAEFVTEEDVWNIVGTLPDGDTVIVSGGYESFDMADMVLGVLVNDANGGDSL